MNYKREVCIPSLVKIKPVALDRVGVYLSRARVSRVLLLHSEGLPESIVSTVLRGIQAKQLEIVQQRAICDARLEHAEEVASQASPDTDCVVGLGGGKAIDVAKFVASLLKKPLFSVPTSLSNDGFSSPNSSLVVRGKRQSVPAAVPFSVVVDTKVCLQAPKYLWLSGVGDLVAKLTAVRDWKLAFHFDGTAIDDFAALLSDSSVYQFIARPEHSLDGMKLLATALMLNGVAMSVCGSSRPASGSEHLISHALDSFSQRPRLHGIQVGLATYLVSHLEGFETARIASLFHQTGFWRELEQDPFSRHEWHQALNVATSVKANFYTILSRAGSIEKLRSILDTDELLQPCFTDS